MIKKTAHFHLEATTMVVVLLSANILLLVFQLWLPIENALAQTLFPAGAAPEWIGRELSWSLVPQASLNLIERDCLLLAVFIFLVLMCRSRARTRQLLYVVAATGVAHAVIAVMAWYTRDHLVNVKALDGHFDLMRGLFINRNHFANYLVISMMAVTTPLLYFWFRLSHLNFLNKLRHTVLSNHSLYVGAILFIGFCILMSESRAGVAGFSIVIVMACLFAFQEIGRFNLRRTAIIGVALSVALLVLVVIFGEAVSQRLFSSDSILGERSTQWLLSWKIFLNEPILGFGGGSYALVFQAYREHVELREVLFDQAHNDFLHIMVEQGVIGLSLWLGVLTVTLARCVNSIRLTRSRYRRAMLASVSAVIVASLFQSFFDFNLQIMRIRILFFVSLALVFILAHHDMSRSKAKV
ncbi:MAG: O-antigen ligase family protein [Pseudomonadota bacterium]